MSKKKVIAPNVVRGGIAIPLKGKTNYYYMSGRKHKNGGIDIGKNPRTGLEVEDGEVMHVNNNEIKVFSSVPFLNGESPAQKVLEGENPTTVFREQENFKDRNGINDDGTRKKQNGGRIYTSLSNGYYDDRRNNLGVYTTRTDAIRGPQIVQREDLIGDIAKMNRAIQKHEQNLYNSSRPRTDLNFRVSSPTGDVVTNDPSNLWWSNKLHFKRNIPLGILYTDEKGNDVPFYTEAVVTGRRPKKIHEYSSSDIASGVTGGVLNWSSPSQIAGTISDIYNKKPNWSEGMILGNSGFVSDEFMQEHPVYGSLVNLAGDIAITGPKAVSRIPKGVTSLAKNTKKVVTAGRNIGRQAISKIDDIVEQGNNKITAAKNRFNDVVDNLQNQLYPSRQAYVQGVDGNYYSVDDVFGDNYMSFSKRKNKSKRKNTIRNRNNTLNNGKNTADDEIRIPEPDPDEVDNATIFEQADESNTKSDPNTSNVVDDVDDVDYVDDVDDTQTYNNKTNNKNKPLFRRLIRNIWEKEKKPWISIPTGMGIMGGGIATYNWLNDRKSPDEDIYLNIDETYTPIGNDTTTIPYISPKFDEPEYYNIEDSIKRMGGPIRNRKQYVTKRDTTYVAPRFVKEEQTRRLYTTKLTDNEERQFQDWYRRVAKYKNLNPNPDAVGQDYDYRGYWKNEDRETIFDDKKGHFTDKYKQPTHPTFSNQSMYSNNITPGGEWIKGKGTFLFKHNNYTARQAKRTHDYLMDTGEGYILGTDTIIPTSRKRMGGLSRYKDINASVYNKYPELRKNAKAVGLYSVTVDGKTSLRRFPSTGERTKAALGTKVNQPDEPISTTITNPLKDNLSKEKDLYFDKLNWFRRARINTGNYLKNNPGAVNDLIGLTSNITGGLLSHRINRKMLNRLQYIVPPTPRSAVKLKTHININPQLDRMRESLANYERTINDNTTSSNVALARRNQARLANTMQANELYGNRENAETQLINQDRTNQQNVANENIADYNKWLEGLNAFRNSIIDKKSENNISLVENINSGIQDLINRREKRRSDNQTIAAMALANPDLPIEIFYNQGILKKSVFDDYIKAYRNRNKKTTTQQE